MNSYNNEKRLSLNKFMLNGIKVTIKFNHESGVKSFFDFFSTLSLYLASENKYINEYEFRLKVHSNYNVPSHLNLEKMGLKFISIKITNKVYLTVTFKGIRQKFNFRKTDYGTKETKIINKYKVAYSHSDLIDKRMNILIKVFDYMRNNKLQEQTVIKKIYLTSKIDSIDTSIYKKIVLLKFNTQKKLGLTPYLFEKDEKVLTYKVKKYRSYIRNPVFLINSIKAEKNNEGPPQVMPPPPVVQTSLYTGLPNGAPQMMPPPPVVQTSLYTGLPNGAPQMIPPPPVAKTPPQMGLNMMTVSQVRKTMPDIVSSYKIDLNDIPLIESKLNFIIETVDEFKNLDIEMDDLKRFFFISNEKRKNIYYEKRNYKFYPIIDANSSYFELNSIPEKRFTILNSKKEDDKFFIYTKESFEVNLTVSQWISTKKSYLLKYKDDKKHYFKMSDDIEDIYAQIESFSKHYKLLKVDDEIISKLLNKEINTKREFNKKILKSDNMECQDIFNDKIKVVLQKLLKG